MNWKESTHLLLEMTAALLLCLPACSQVHSTSDEKALQDATRGLCRAKVAMLGEIATHGDGHTLDFKVALVERLVDQCHFNAVFFEANQDEFLRLNQRLRDRERVTPNDLLTAVGGLWKFYTNFQPLASFLVDRAQAGRVVLGGLDDQLAQLGQDYANEGMLTEFAHLLPAEQQQVCIMAFHRRVYYDFPADKPYSKADQSELQSCLAEEQSAAVDDATVPPEAKEERHEMISATQRWIDRDFTPDGENMANRDRSMFQTFKWLQQRIPGNSKIILWAATVHIAKRGNPIWGDRRGTNLGSFISREYGKRAKSLGFSAIAGSFRQGKGSFPSIPVPPADSVEALATRGTSSPAVYVGPKQLAAMGTRPGAFFQHSYQTLPWREFLDGAVIFETERPPADTRK